MISLPNWMERLGELVDDRVLGRRLRRASRRSDGSVISLWESARTEKGIDCSRVLASPEEPAVFLGGVTGRSGTTWLMRILRRTLPPGRAVIGEHGTFVMAQFRSAPYEYYQTTTGREPYLSYLRRFFTGPGYRRDRAFAGPGLEGFSALVPPRILEIAVNRLFDQWRREVELSSLYRSLGDFYSWLHNFAAMARVGRSAWISKEPGYVRHADDLFRMIPSARLVVMVRDGRSSALSMVEQGWHGSVEEAIRRWATFAARAAAALDTVPRERVLFVPYRKLVTDFAETVVRVHQFLDVSVAREDIARLPRSLLPDASPLERWRDELTPSAIEMWDREGAKWQEHLDRLAREALRR